ncbi:MAG: hypothetical protein LLG45_13380 [Actinomycetia bacterium]|nr:hypothetical protein [Actinomycetes bacterium]
MSSEIVPDPDVTALVDAAYSEMTPSLIRILTRSATASYAAGVVDSYRTIRTPEASAIVRTAAPGAGRVTADSLNFRMISEDAERYGNGYGELLEKEGATIINGKPNPWLKNLTAEERAKISEIIQKGIRNGKPTGVTELKKGGYPKGSIAADLEDFFNGRKSHASMVARSEVARIQNHASLDSFDRHGVGKVTVHDGHAHGSCEKCNAIDGEIWTVPYAQANDDHPNGTRYYDAYYGPEPAVRG